MIKTVGAECSLTILLLCILNYDIKFFHELSIISQPTREYEK